MTTNEQLRNLPKVDELLKRCDVIEWTQTTVREVVVEALRQAIDETRSALLSGEETETGSDAVIALARRILTTSERRNLRRVINGTGILLHTNLGRARLADSAAVQVTEVAKGYSTLEYDLMTGQRGSRHDHVSSLIARITGAEAAMVVNNNASATLLCLMAIARDREVVVSRGELVEIGGSFRIPEIMALGGTVLREVGTTNKTHLSDYENVIGDQTGALLKVHTSNYRIIGFTQDVSVPDLAELAHCHGLPMIHDLGSGLIVDLRDYGLDEPTVGRSLAEGADVVLFSGDKLLGGPQAGILVGKMKYIERMKRHPLARVVRVDKMTLAGLEETFRLYRDSKQACRDIPVLSMITASLSELEKKADSVITQLSVCINARFSVCREVGRVGGGSAPMLDLPTIAVSVEPLDRGVSDLERQLRCQEPPVIARISEGRLLLDMRTISDAEIPIVVKLLLDILG
jgi:L-seryl-tRNA(Ser) seleniumtransferase